MKVCGWIIFVLFLSLRPVFSFAQFLNFTNSTIVSIQSDPGLKTALTVFQEVAKEHSDVDLRIKNNLSFTGNKIIIGIENAGFSVSPEADKALRTLSETGKEGFKIVSLPDKEMVIVAGHDERGALYGAGYLLRKMELRKDKILVPDSLNISSTPKYPIRGHQLGYRPKTNAYDAWTVAQFDHYIRDLVLFGANSIEIMPDKTDDDFENKHMVLPAIKMIAEQSKIAAGYGMDVWMWYPNMGTNYTNPDSVQKELNDHERIFKAVPELDHLFVPGGDPGDLEPEIQFNWLKKLAVVLHRYHPHADIWVSPQVFRPSEKWFDSFYREVNKKYPWFGGVVYGPWVKETIKEVREKVNRDIPIRRYPDITHSLLSQYPVPEWDLAFAVTLDREAYNPRPYQEKLIHNLFAKYADGSISYSEGINDDVNKFVWSGQDWDPDTPVKETLRDYARLFIGPDYAEKIANALVGLEHNFKGPLAVNEGVRTTFSQWRDMEKNASPEVLSNYRFQMGLLRAYFDAYTQRRLVYETELESEARGVLEDAKKDGSMSAVKKAETILEKAKTDPVGIPLYNRIIALKDSVYRSIGYQVTSAEPQAGEEGRGNFVDNINLPLNNAPWLLEQLEKIEKMRTEGERLPALEEMLNRRHPGPGGYYDNLGSFDSWKHIVRQKTWRDDPGGLESPIIDFGAHYQNDEWVEILPVGFDHEAVPQAWMTQVTALYNTPLVMKYEELDPAASYKIKIAYTGRFNSHLRLMADDKFMIHNYLQVGKQPVYEFDIPKTATEDGKLKLTWNCLPGERGTQVSEVWIMKE